MEGVRDWSIFWKAPWQKKKKPWAIFVDSTILVNGYHIYSTACNYNSSVSNLCFAFWDASQVFLVVANFPPFLRPIFSPVLVKIMLGGDSPRPKTGDLNDVTMSPHPPPSIFQQGLWEKGSWSTSQEQGTYLCVLFHSQSQVWLTLQAHKGGSLLRAETRKRAVPFPRMSL